MGEAHRDAPYGASEERPPWIEEALDQTHWDLAFGSYGDGYLEWVNSRYYWDPLDPRSPADARSLWAKRGRYLDDATSYLPVRGAGQVSNPNTL